MSKVLTAPKNSENLHYISLCKSVYNKEKLNDDQVRCLNENGDELQTSLKKLIEQFFVFNHYADEEIKSNYNYPNGYKGPKPIRQQIDALANIFGLSLKHANKFVDKVLPTIQLPEGAEGWFAVPSINALANRFFPEIKDFNERMCAASSLILAKINESRRFYNYREKQLTPNHFRLNERTTRALDILEKQQKGDIWVVGGQFGKLHAGRSVRRTRRVMTNSEFGGYTVAVGSMLLTHPERLVSYDDLWFDVPGNEFDLNANGSFDRAPFFFFFVGLAGFDMSHIHSTDERYGPASLFLP